MFEAIIFLADRTRKAGGCCTIRYNTVIGQFGRRHRDTRRLSLHTDSCQVRRNHNPSCDEEPSSELTIHIYLLTSGRSKSSSTATGWIALHHATENPGYT